jgi:outer membrane protein TolC
VIKGFGYDYAITNGTNFSTVIGVNQTIPNRKSLSAQFENLQLMGNGINNSSKISEQDLKRTVTSQYITTYGDQEQLAFAKQVRDLLTKEEIILKKLTAGNVYRQVDYLAFLVTLQQQDFAVKQLSLQLLNNYATLNYLSGINDTSFLPLETPAVETVKLPGPDHSVFFQQFIIDSLKLLNSKALIDAGYRPKFNLFADAGFISSFAYRGYRNFGTSFGVGASIPIYDGRQKKMQYSKIALQEKTRQGYQSFFGQQYKQQVAQLTQQLHATESLISDISNQLKYTESLVTVNGKLLETGEVKMADYILALNTYLNTKNLVTQNRISRLQIINQLNYWNR